MLRTTFTKNSFNGFVASQLCVGIVLVSSSMLAAGTHFPDELRSFLSIAWIAYVPLGTGYHLMSLLTHCGTGIEDKEWLPHARVLISWTIGMLGLLVVSLISMRIGLFTQSVWGISMLSFVTALYLLKFVCFPLSRKLPDLKRVYYSSMPIVFGLLVGFVFVLFVRSNSPYPLTPGSDAFTHLYVIKGVLYNSSTASSPLLYTPSIHVIIALAIDSFGASSEGVLWAGVFLTFLTYSVSMFVLAREFLGWPAAILASIFSLAFNEQGLTPNLPVFYPSSIVMSMFPLSLLVIYKWARQENWLGVRQIVQFGIICAGLVCIHFQLGIVASTILSSVLLLTRIATKWTKHVRVISLLLSITVLLYYLQMIPYQINLDFLGNEYLYSLQTKVVHINNWFSPVLFLLSIMGLIISAFALRNKIAFGLVANALLLVYFQRIPNVHRITNLLNPLLGIATSLAVVAPFILLDNIHLEIKLISELTGKIQINIHDLLISKRYHAIYVLFAFVVLFPSIVSPYSNYINYYADKGLNFYDFTQEELEVGRWLFQNTSANTIVYSDPATILVMRGLAFRKHVEAVAWNMTIGEKIKLAIASENASEAFEYIVSMVGKEVVIVITPRTSRWVRSWPNEYMVFLPLEKLEPFTGFEKFLDQGFFLLLYQTANVFVFSLKL
ncbi:MAG: hypothetical protein NWF11_01640 [Candidatus Bathyarchaeota archaeon]|nr:hypothetical protein [Candidatus Bathyarchaeota archaeon]